MANAITQTLGQLGQRLRNGPVGQFFRWWVSELEQAMPETWRQKLQEALRRVTLQNGPDGLELGFDENRRISLLDRLPADTSITVQKQRINDLLNDHDLVEAPRFLLMDRSKVLTKRVRLPAAAEANLATVLGFEMDRQTPFRASDVYYDYRLLDRGSESGQVELDLFVVPRNVIDGAVEGLKARGFELAGVDIVDQGTTQGLNLLPNDMRSRPANPRFRLNMALGGGLLLLIAALMMQSLYLREHQIAELEEAISSVQGEARRVMRIKEDIADTSDAASFLARMRAAAPLTIELLADVTRIMPDDTYLDRLVINETTVQMQGKSQNAQQLIELVNESTLLQDAEFRGSTRLDARSGLEIFEVNASISSTVQPTISRADVEAVAGGR